MEIITNSSGHYGVQGIYAIINVNKLSKKCPHGTPYIGQAAAQKSGGKGTLGIGRRVCQHRYELKKNIHRNQKLQRAWNKYGESSFVFMVLERVGDRERLTEREQHWIDEWDAYKRGYNIVPFAQSNIGLRKRTDLTEEVIVGWIERYVADHNGRYPHGGSGKIEYAPKKEPLTWCGLSACMTNGYRGLPGGTTVSKFISEHFHNDRNRINLPSLSEEDILNWAEQYKVEFGRYPTMREGQVKYFTQGRLTWCAVNACLDKGLRGLPGGTTLSRLIVNNLVNVNKSSLHRLLEEDILRWAEQYKVEFGRYPHCQSGRVNFDGSYFTWANIDVCLRRGHKGLSGGSSLSKLLKSRGKK